MDYDELKKLLEFITPGPWKREEEMHGHCVCGAYESDGGSTVLADNLIDVDAEFIAIARTAVPVLLAERDGLAKKCDAWRASYMIVADAVAAASESPKSLADAARATRAERDALRKEAVRIDEENGVLKGKLVATRQERTALGSLIGKLLCIAGLQGLGGKNIDHGDALLDWARELRAENERLLDLVKVMESRIERFEELEPDARSLAEWANTIAIDGSIIKATARRYLSGERAALPPPPATKGDAR